MKTRFAPAVLLSLALLPRAADPPGSPVLQVMKAELARSLQVLATQTSPPYFLSYEITSTHSVNVSGSFGAITSTNESRGRLLDIDLRVGDYNLDNAHPLRGGFPDFSERFSLIDGFRFETTQSQR